MATECVDIKCVLQYKSPSETSQMIGGAYGKESNEENTRFPVA
jgi:hypothetical protein